MKRDTIIATTAVALGLAGGVAAFAKAGADTENNALADLAKAKAKVTLSQAISAAEAQAGGRAIQAELDGENGTTVYKVEVVSADSQARDVTVDVTEGKVLSSKLDQADHGGKESNEASEGGGQEENDQSDADGIQLDRKSSSLEGYLPRRGQGAHVEGRP
jgi:uncharacterized membrane protein YkoI